MTDDVLFIDSFGERLDGFAACSSAARAFHRLEPDCRVEVIEAFERAGTIMLRVNLEARDPRLRGLYLIGIKLRGNRVCEWQIHRRKPVPYSRVLRRESASAA